MLVFVLTGVNEAQAAPAFQAAGTAIGGAGAVTPTWPAHAVDDIALLFIESRGEQAITLTSNTAGFVAVANSPQNTGTTATGTRLTVYWTRATSTAMANPTVGDPGDHVVAQILTYRGVVNTGNPWDVTGGGVKAAASTAVSATGVTTTVLDTLVVVAVSQGFDATSTTTFSGWANTNLTSINERADFAVNNGDGGGFGVMDGVMATAGATGNTTATMSNSFANAFLTIALKPQPPTVSSINLASTNPTAGASSVSWTVVFSASVTGVDATDFALIQAGGVSGATITSVTGGGTTWTVTAATGTGTGTLGLNLVDDDTIVDAGGNKLGGTGAGNGNFTGQVYTVSAPFCSPPSNVPVGVTVSCVCDQFGRASLNPSTIFGSNWIVSRSDTITPAVVPYINATSGLLRLTENNGNNAKAATVPGIFPAAGNYISVEFQHYAYSGSGADGIAVTLSDYSVTAVPGAFGGSLGYAPKDAASCGVAGGCPGFAGGWVGVALDEFGNYQNPTEGRTGGPGSRPDSVGVRGSGSGLIGYNWVAGTTTLATGIDNTGSATPAPGYYYQVIVDARNAANATPQTFISVNRDTTSGAGTAYGALVAPFDIFAANPSQAVVPVNWQISFTGSTGGSTNVHEIGGLRICAQTVAPPSGGTASGFNAIDEAYGTPPSGPAVQSFLNGHIYMKVAGTPFKLNVAALNNNQIVTTYAAGGTKNVAVKLVDNSDGACVLDSTQSNYCSATCTGKTAVTGGSQTLAFVAADSGKKQSTNFTINSAYKNLVAIISDSTTTACSTDAFSVRPASINQVTSSNAAYVGVNSPPTINAGANFALTATVTGIANYTGTPKINSTSALEVGAAVTGTLAGTFSPAAPSGADSAATGGAFTYTEVGAFKLRVADFTVPRIPGVYDDNWTTIDSDPTKNDCITGTAAAAYSNTKDVNGKYGCNFGTTADTGNFGRFTPAYFNVAATHACVSGSPFTYSGQPFATVVVTPYSAGGGTINNYRSGSFAKDVTISDAGNLANFNGTNTLLGASAFPGAGINGSSSTVTYTFPVKETAPLTLTLRAIDTDNISSSGHSEASMVVRSGRLIIQNGFGSELVDLAVPMRAQYYFDANTGWVTNSNDTCTAVTLSALSYVAGSGTLVAGDTCVQDNGVGSGLSGQGCPAIGPVAERFTEGGVVGFAGDYNLYLRKPTGGHTGSVDIITDLSVLSLTPMPWLQFDWDGNGVADNNPQGRATFGIYKGSPRNIYLRERY